MNRGAKLPIDPLLPEITGRVDTHGQLVLQAAPGAGKTTRVPQALLDAGLAGGREVWVVEPRRIAAASAAAFVAAERGGAVGGEVGYRVRFEALGGASTRLWFMTDGLAARRLARDPFLERVGVLVLDEFHERRVIQDVLLGAARELRETVRPDLKLVVLSATLEGERVARFLGDSPILVSEGQAFPVAIDHEAGPSEAPLVPRVSAAVARALDHEGDILVFLPGAREIRRVAEALEALAASRDLDVVPLHGDLPLEAQRRAILRGPRRKIVLATNVAETSLTIEGVTTVVDSGLARQSRFDPRLGIDRLTVVRISRASAAQRAGRAGRTAPGRAIRLWTRAEHAERLEHETPEVRRVDLTGPLLEIAAWGLREPSGFPWLDAPSGGAVESARTLLEALGALEPGSWSVTSAGRRMLDLAAPPRLARMVLEADRLGVAAGGALLAAIASERELLSEERALGARNETRWPSGSSDLILRAELVRKGRQELDRGAARAVERASDQLLRSLERQSRLPSQARGSKTLRSPKATADEDLLRAVLAGFPDRVCRRRAKGSSRAVMVGGRGVVLDPRSVVRDAELFVATDVDGGAPGALSESRVRSASAIERSWLPIRREAELVWDPARERVVERRRELYRDLVLDEETIVEVEREPAGRVLADRARELPLGERETALVERLRFLRAAMPELAFDEPEALFARALEAAAAGKRTLAELRKVDLVQIASGLLGHAAWRALEREAPETISLPSGRAARIRYERDRPPTAGAKIQQLFGLRATPRLAAGRVPVLLEIRAPSDRPVQVTDDLESFWRRTYPEVRKQLRGRYPKHAWPEDPLLGMEKR